MAPMGVPWRLLAIAFHGGPRCSNQSASASGTQLVVLM